jgi:opacity protein-like surface antigen
MAGPRFWYVRGARYSAFAQALGGLLRETASVQVLDVTISESENRLGLLSGAGLDVKVGDRWALRLSADYVWSTKDGESRGGFRAGLGAAYRF